MCIRDSHDNDGLHQVFSINNTTAGYGRERRVLALYGNSAAIYTIPAANATRQGGTLLLPVNARNSHEIVGFQAGAANQGAIDVGDAHQFLGIGRLD